MKKLQFATLFILTFFALPVMALDPVAPRSERSTGLVYVTTPLPASDVVTLTSSKNPSQTYSTPSGQMIKVPVGNYLVSVKMQDQHYTQDIVVNPTERTDVVVPGYGNLRVNSSGGSAAVEVYKAGTNSKVASFATNQVKTLPSGRYDVKAQVGKFTLNQNNVWIVTNTTREIDVKF